MPISIVAPKNITWISEKVSTLIFGIDSNNKGIINPSTIDVNKSCKTRPKYTAKTS